MSEHIPFEYVDLNPDLVESEGKILVQFKNDHDLTRYLQTDKNPSKDCIYRLREDREPEVDWTNNIITFWYEVPGDW